MRTALVLLLTLPLFACEPKSMMEQSGETLDDASDGIADTIEDIREDVEENIEEATN
jgi:hypothetical protein